MELTDAIQDYVKEIYKLEAAGRRPTTSALAAELGVSPPSVTSMLKKLSSLGLEEHIDRTLGFPTRDPHGDPIPGPDLKIVRVETTLLSTLEAGDKATVERIPDGDGELLRYLSKLKLTPGSRLEVRESAPFDGPLTVRVAGTDHAISRELAEKISVT
jgi:DtxR family Mn-dependent transcriptional regulator